MCYCVMEAQWGIYSGASTVGHLVGHLQWGIYRRRMPWQLWDASKMWHSPVEIQLLTRMGANPYVEIGG